MAPLQTQDLRRIKVAQKLSHHEEMFFMPTTIAAQDWSNQTQDSAIFVYLMHFLRILLSASVAWEKPTQKRLVFLEQTNYHNKRVAVSVCFAQITMI